MNSNTTFKNYVGGRFVTGSKFFDSINPVDGSLVAKVSEADDGMLDEAVQSARDALDTQWLSTSAEDRCRILHQIADGIEKRFQDFVDAEIADTGKPIKQVASIDIPRGIANFRFFADLVKVAGSECFELETPDGIRAINYSIRKPLGVIGVISPWNLPLLLLTWKIGPALAAGNCIVAKPSEETPGTATLLAEVIHGTDIPAGVFNLLHGFGEDSIGEKLAKHSGVDAITFTGESATGSSIMRSAADNVKSLSFELGGKNAAIICDDANFESAVDGTVRSTFSNCGQVCLSSERVYVQENIFEDFISAFKSKAEALKMSWPKDKDTDIGPLISIEHRKKVLSYFTQAAKDGATVITGGKIPEFGDRRDNGAWIEPTIFTGLSESHSSVKEEIFGPVCHVAPFKTVSEVISKVNDSKYGLAAALWTKDLHRAHSLAHQLEVGIVWVNSWYLRDLRTPFGGVKLSGIGREGGLHSLNFYSELSNICIKL
tara:strand:+ start:479 stop:1942 length:1464 start_codon:yes stop_codon:yes gene_type:complete